MRRIVNTRESILEIIEARKHYQPKAAGYVRMGTQTSLYNPENGFKYTFGVILKGAFWESEENAQELSDYKFIRIIDHHAEIYFTIYGKDLHVLVWSFINNSFMITDMYKKVVKELNGQLKACFDIFVILQNDFDKYSKSSRKNRLSRRVRA